MDKDLLQCIETVNERKEKLFEEINYIKERLFNYAQKSEELTSLRSAMDSDVNFWQDVDKAQEIVKRISYLEKTISSIDNLFKLYEDVYLAIEFAYEDDTYYVEAQSLFEQLIDKIQKLKVQALLSGKYDMAKAIVSITAGAGGTEAQDWAQMLYRMYSMFASKYGYKIEVLDMQEGEVAGIKSISFTLEGEWAYGYMKCEMGVHRLVRISPFDSGARRHTSFASVEVVPEIQTDDEVEIRDEDIRIDTYRASGAGGQHINKTDSAIRITHFPTGIVVTCQNERSQIQNREKAFNVLRSKLLAIKLEKEAQMLQDMKGDIKKIEWGSQIRSYVFCPYTLVKDHRTNFENTNVEAVMDGEIMPFIEDYLKKK